MKLSYPHIEPTGYTSWGRTEFVVAEDFHLRIDMGKGEYDFYVVHGFKTDFGSIPWPLQLFISPLDPRLLVGWLIHDEMYANHLTTRFFADSLMRYIHQCYKAPWYVRVAVYYGVRLCGWFRWRKVSSERQAEKTPNVAAQVKVWVGKKDKDLT